MNQYLLGVLKFRVWPKGLKDSDIAIYLAKRLDDPGLSNVFLRHNGIFEAISDKVIT